MPTLAAAQTSNASFRPPYAPVAVFVGATSGVGQGMVEAFARYVSVAGCGAHIILVGRNEHAAAEIIAGLPNHNGGEYTYEFIPCDLSIIANVRALCADIQKRVERVNFLVMTAGYSSFAHPGITEEGLDLHLALRYYYRFVLIQSLLPLLQNAKSLGQDARVMAVLGAGRGSPDRPIDLDNLGNTAKPRSGARAGVSFRAMQMSSGYTDAMLAHFATQNPTLSFTHIMPGAVRTTFRADLDGLLGLGALLSWVLNYIVLPLVCVSKEVCAEYMLYALLPSSAPNRDRGLFLCDHHGDAVSSLSFDSDSGASLESSEDNRTSFINGVEMKGYGASDLAVRKIVEYSEAVTRARD